MDITAVSALEPAKKEELSRLLAACRQKEPLTLSFPMDGADWYVLISDSGYVRSAAAFLREEELVWECAAFTHPAYRRKGLFSAALERGLSLLPPEAELLFYADGKSLDAQGTLLALGAEFLGSEYMMELSPETKLPSLSPALKIQAAQRLTEEGTLLSFSCPYGSVRLLEFESHYYLYDFEIHEPFRGQGYGKRFLSGVLKLLARRRRLPVSLQVSQSNPAAVGLYEKTGFRITETLSCFLY